MLPLGRNSQIHSWYQHRHLVMNDTRAVIVVSDDLTFMDHAFSRIIRMLDSSLFQVRSID